MNLCTLFETALINTPDKTAVVCGDERCTYAELDLHSRAYALAFKKLGLNKGDRLGLFMPNRLEIIYCYFACFRLGIIATPTRIFSTTAELLYAAGKCGIKMYIVDSKLLSVVDGIVEQLPDLERILYLDRNDEIPADQLLEPYLDYTGSKIPPVSVEPDDPAWIVYTSGSTGRPKGVTHTHDSFYANAVYRDKTLHHSPDHVFLTTSFLCHCAASTSILLPILHAGGTAVFLQDESVEIVPAMIQKHQVTHAASSPTFWMKIISHPDCSRDHFSALQYATSGGDGVPVSLQDDFYAMVGIPLTASVGMTECGGYMTIPPPLEQKRGSVGKPIRGVEVRLVDEEYNDVPQGSIGQILVRGRNVMSGYWRDPENTKAAFKKGWFITGDLARRDDDDYYYFAGRCKNTIIRDASNVTPDEVEYVLNHHQAVKQSIVVGVPDAKHGQAVFAFIQPDNPEQPPTAKELTAYARTNLAERKEPGYYFFVSSFQGEGIMDKINRKKLEKKAAQLVEAGKAQAAG